MLFFMNPTHLAFISQIEPKIIDDALDDKFWVHAIQEELNQFVRNKVWTLVPRPKHHSTIGTKWVFRKTMNEQGIINRNKARVVAKGYNQEEGIVYDETFAPLQDYKLLDYYLHLYYSWILIFIKWMLKVLF